MTPEQPVPKKRLWHLPYSKKIASVIETFTLTEKVIFYFFVCVFFLSAVALVWQVNSLFLVAVPDYGGTLREGVIGSPRFVNPLLDLSDSDRDLSALVYSGLMRANASGALIPDLAQSYTVSDNGLTYIFTLKSTATFHDGTPVTADDVIYTIQKAQDSALSSPRKSNWDGVTVTKIDNHTVQFTLIKQYAPFIQNTTLGILPKHIWSKATDEEFPFSQFNQKPIGSGPYTVDSITYTPSGLPSEYHLSAFPDYTLGKPYITQIVIKSYQNEAALVDAYKSGDIDSLYGISPNQLPQLSIKQDSVDLAPLPRVFGVFFNQNVAPVFLNPEVRQALDLATDKQAIINEVLAGYGQHIDGAIPPQTLARATTSGDMSARMTQAKNMLIKAGWKQNTDGIFQKTDAKKNTTTLSFSISTGDAPELKATVEMLQKQWQALGAVVSVKIFEVSDLNQNIIRPRKYDALLFGEIVGRDLDLYPFWDSSQRTDPGLNIAQYANLKVDKAVESVRQTTDPASEAKLFTTFNQEIATDKPAVFIYAPYFIYIVPHEVQNVTLGSLNTAAERFSNVYEWYIETNNVWKLFTK